jgi:hypothetical protein
MSLSSPQLGTHWRAKRKINELGNVSSQLAAAQQRAATLAQAAATKKAAKKDKKKDTKKSDKKVCVCLLLDLLTCLFSFSSFSFSLLFFSCLARCLFFFSTRLSLTRLLSSPKLPRLPPSKIACRDSSTLTQNF